MGGPADPELVAAGGQLPDQVRESPVVGIAASLGAHPDGSATFLGRGTGFEILTPADAQRFGLPNVSVVAGALTEQDGPDGTITSLLLHGHIQVDVCAALS